MAFDSSARVCQRQFSRQLTRNLRLKCLLQSGGVRGACGNLEIDLDVKCRLFRRASFLTYHTAVRTSPRAQRIQECFRSGCITRTSASSAACRWSDRAAQSHETPRAVLGRLLASNSFVAKISYVRATTLPISHLLLNQSLRRLRWKRQKKYRLPHHFEPGLSNDTEHVHFARRTHVHGTGGRLIRYGAWIDAASAPRGPWNAHRSHFCPSD